MAASSGQVLAGLDWQEFSAAYFPGRRRHDLEALTAYGAYKRTRPMDERSSASAGGPEETRNGTADSTALQSWEDEGGAAPYEDA